MEYDSFKSCLQIWLRDDPIGTTYKADIKFNYASNTIEGWTQYVTTEYFEDVGRDAKTYLAETREIETTYNMALTFSLERIFADLEIYNVLVDETIVTLILAACTVIAVVLFITANF